MRLITQLNETVRKIVMKVEDGPVLKGGEVRYRTKPIPDRQVTKISASKVDDRPWELQVNTRALKKDGTFYQSGGGMLSQLGVIEHMDELGEVVSEFLEVHNLTVEELMTPEEVQRGREDFFRKAFESLP